MKSKRAALFGQRNGIAQGCLMTLLIQIFISPVGIKVTTKTFMFMFGLNPFKPEAFLAVSWN